MVFNLYLSTKPLSSVYFFPVGSFTRIHFGFPFGGKTLFSVVFSVMLILFFKILYETISKDTFFFTNANSHKVVINARKNNTYAIKNTKI